MTLTVRQMPDSDYLHQCFDYNPDSGGLTWKARPVSHFKSEALAINFNNKHVGKIAGCVLVTKTGKYIMVRIDGALLYAHRIIYKMFYGREPKIIDHIDGNGINNSIKNIRSCTTRDNSRNKRLFSTNTSGCTGVVWSRKKKRWGVNIVVDAKQIYLGSFADFNNAVKARRDAEIKYGFHANHGTNKARYSGEIKR